MKKQPWIYTGIALLILGILISTYLVVHHFSLIYALSGEKSFCSVSAKFDCDAVNTSKYSEFFGVPIALFGALTLFAQLLLLIGYSVFGESEKPIIGRFFLYISTWNMVVSVLLGLVSTFDLKTFCIMCASLYIINLVVFVSALKIVGPKPFSNLFSDLPKLFKSGAEEGARGILILLIAIPAASFLFSGMYEKSILSSSDFSRVIEKSISDWHDSPVVDFKGVSGPEMGNPTASFQIVEFSDFECPHCRRAAPAIHAFVNAHRDNVHFVFQNYPLDSSCNPKGGAHEHACALARASLCALKQNKFVEAHDWIFTHQDTLDSSSVDAMVSEAKLDKVAFDTCMKGTEVSEELKKQIDFGNLANIQGTPSVFVNGKILPAGFLIPVLEAALKESK